MAAVGDRVGGDRAQVVLIGALALAVSLVVLAVVLNSAIYTENLATRSNDPGTGAAVDVRESVRTGVGGITDRVNEDNAGDQYATLYGSHLPAAMDEWRPMMVRHRVASGQTLRVATVGGSEGTRIADDTDGTFTPRTSATSWLVAGPVEVRNFRLSDVNPADLTSTSDPETTADVFFVEVRETGGSDEWRVYVHEDGGNVGVKVWDEDDGSAVGSCTTDSVATVDLTRATLNGQPCRALTFLEEVDGLAEIRYVNGDDIQGTYELTVDQVGHETGDPLKDRVDAVNYGDHCSGPTYYDTPGAGHPYAVAGIYSTTVDFRYVSQSVTYETQVRAASAEPGPTAEHPVVTDVTVTETTGSGASFDVSWAVADPNADLDSVDVTLNRGGSTVDDPPAVSVSGDSGSGSVTLSESGGDGNTYTVVVEVTDDGGHGRSASETHLADDDNSGCPP